MKIEVDVKSIIADVNPVYRPYLFNKDRLLCYYGSSGSGKSVAGIQKLILRILLEENHKLIAFRKVRSTVKESVMALTETLNKKYGLSKLTKVYKSADSLRIEYKPFNSAIHFMGMDDPEKIKSIDGVTGIHMEELTEFEPEDLDQAGLRMRGENEHGHYYQITGAFNPINEKHWIKTQYIPPHITAKTFSIPDQTFVHTTFKDNMHIDEAFKKHLEKQIKKNPGWARVYYYGMWGNTNFKGNAYAGFDRSKIVIKDNEEKQEMSNLYKEELPLCLAFDFNTKPYCTLNVWQFDNENATQIDEICLPDSRTKDAAKEFCKRYKKHTAGVTVYGDPAGKSQDTRTEPGTNDYTIILDEIKQFKPNLHVLPSAPSVKYRCEWISEIFEGESNIKIKISSRCTNTINDYEQIKKNPDGTKKKEMATDKETKVRYQRLGHTSDANDCALTARYPDEFGKFKKSHNPTGNRIEFYTNQSNNSY